MIGAGHSDRAAQATWHVAAGERAAELGLAQFDAEGPGRTSQGLARYSSLAADPAASRADVARAVLGRAAGLLIGRADPVRARRAAEAGYRAYPDLRAGEEAHALAALCDLLLGDVRAAVARLDERNTESSPSTAVAAGGIEALVRVLAGDVGAAERCVSETAERRDRYPEQQTPIWAEPALDLATVLLHASRGQLRAANTTADGHRRLAARDGRRPLAALWSAVMGHLAMLAGDLDAADRACVDALATAEGCDPYGSRAVATCQQALVAARRGAVHLVAERLRELGALGVGSHAWLAFDLRRVHAWLAVQSGRSQAAVVPDPLVATVGGSFGDPPGRCWRWSGTTRQATARPVTCLAPP